MQSRDWNVFLSRIHQRSSDYSIPQQVIVLVSLTPEQLLLLDLQLGQYMKKGIRNQQPAGSHRTASFNKKRQDYVYGNGDLQQYLAKIKHDLRR